MTDLQKWLDGGYKEVYASEAEQMMLAALRAVVELHKSSDLADIFGGYLCAGCDSSWPCPTIRAIEKEVLR